MGEGSGSRREEVEVRVSCLHLRGTQLEGWRGTDCGGEGVVGPSGPQFLGSGAGLGKLHS